MSIKSALIISGAILAAALGIYWIAAPREACPEELYRQYMQLSPFEQFDQKEKLLKKAAQAGCIPAMRQMADHNFISKNDLKAEEYNYWIKKAADHGSPQAQYEAFTECISENPSEVLAYLIQADRQSYAPASLELGRLYACGDEEYGIMRDERKAMEFYQKAAALNNPEALYLLYLMGKLEIPSREEAERHPDALCPLSSTGTAAESVPDHACRHGRRGPREPSIQGAYQGSFKNLPAAKPESC